MRTVIHGRPPARAPRARLVAGALALAMPLLGLVLPVLLSAPAEAYDVPAGSLVRQTPASGTPHVLDGSVLSVVQVGDQIVLGGSFTSARNDDTQTAITRNRLLSFGASTGRISTSFNPSVNGRVEVVLPAGDGQTVFVGGRFTSIGGVARTNIARVRVSDGSVVTSFNVGSVTGTVNDLRLIDGRLWMGGGFTHVGGYAQRALATVNPTTGAFSGYMRLALAGIHNDGATTVAKMDATPDGSRLAVVGNFDTLNGEKRHQMLLLDLTGANAAGADFHTAFYETPCSQSFYSYMRDVDVSPDGRFFVISTTGAYGGSTVACDTTARFETSSTGMNIQPSWVDHTGGDTTYGVEITEDGVVYVGGHQRWQNNPFAGDRAGPGAVSRPGIAALDAVNGLPFSWNPTRTRGVGVFDFLHTDQGLWVASDTDRIGNYSYRGRIALLPAAGGSVIPASVTPRLPNDIYVAKARTLTTPASISKRAWASGTPGPLEAVPGGGLDWDSLRGAFMVNGQLHTAWSNGTFTRRSFDGEDYGSPDAVDTHDQLVALTDWRTDIGSATGMFFDSGRIYFTRSGQNRLYYRYFTPENDVVGAARLVASEAIAGIDFSQVRGMFTTGDELYWATPDGVLHAMDWAEGARSDTPVAGTSRVVSGPAVDGVNWAGRSLFLFQGPGGVGAGPEPTAAFTQSCAGRVCDFDASGSSAPGSSIGSYAWSFGDGATATGVSPAHTYAADGTYTVSLTVTSLSGATDTEQHQVSVEGINTAPVAAFQVSCQALTCAVDASGSSDPDGDALTYAWDFGDGSSGTGETASHTYASAGARTVTLVVSDGTLTASTTRQASPSDAPAPVLQAVGAASTAGNRVTHRVQVPSQVAAGDTLVLFLLTNSTSSTITDALPGWTLVESVDGNGTRGRAWTRAAGPGDAGSTVTVSTSAYTKSTLSVAAYRSSGGSAVVASESRAQNSSGTQHVTPLVPVAEPGSWVISFWGEKSSAEATWAVPAGVDTRTGAAATGSGRVSSVVGDSAVSLGAAQAGGLTATTSESVGRSVMFSVLVAPGSGTP